MFIHYIYMFIHYIYICLYTIYIYVIYVYIYICIHCRHVATDPMTQQLAARNKEVRIPKRVHPVCEARGQVSCRMGTKLHANLWFENIGRFNDLRLFNDQEPKLEIPRFFFLHCSTILQSQRRKIARHSSAFLQATARNTFARCLRRVRRAE